jgi:hypothetical protein
LDGDYYEMPDDDQTGCDYRSGKLRRDVHTIAKFIPGAAMMSNDMIDGIGSLMSSENMRDMMRE